MLYIRKLKGETTGIKILFYVSLIAIILSSYYFFLLNIQYANRHLWLHQILSTTGFISTSIGLSFTYLIIQRPQSSLREIFIFLNLLFTCLGAAPSIYSYYVLQIKVPTLIAEGEMLAEKAYKTKRLYFYQMAVFDKKIHRVINVDSSENFQDLILVPFNDNKHLLILKCCLYCSSQERQISKKGSFVYDGNTAHEVQVFGKFESFDLQEVKFSFLKKSYEFKFEFGDSSIGPYLHESGTDYPLINKIMPTNEQTKN